MKRMFVRFASMIALVLACGETVSRAQSAKAQITGRVTDPSGAVVPGADIRITNARTGIERGVVSSGEGYYTVPLLDPGTYVVRVVKDGFVPVARSGIDLEVNQTARIDFQLSVGAVTEQVVVSSPATLLRSETTDVGQVIDNKRIVEMPLNGRNYLQLAQFTVGVVPATGFRTEEEGGFAAAGMHGYQTNVLLDGNDNSSRSHGGALGFQTQVVKPPVDAVGEFKVITNNTSAEYGFRTGAQVLVSTRSGTNQIHGSAYEFLRNDKLDGTNFFANRAGSANPPYRQNQFGATLGGPIIKNRTFFFGSYQGTRIRIGRSFTSTVPSREALNGDFSNQPAQRRNVFDPLTTRGAGATAARDPFPNNRIPANRFDPVAKRVADFYPAPNISGRESLPNNFFFAPSESNDADQYDFRVDHNLNDMHRLFVRYSIRNQERYEPGPLPLPADGGLGTTTRLNGDNVTLNYGASFRANLHNELRFGWSHFPTVLDIPYTENLNKQFGIPGAPGDTFNDGLDYGYALFVPAGFTLLGSRDFYPNVNNMDNYLVADSVLLQTGAHAIKFGGEFRRLSTFREAERYRRGRFDFEGSLTSERPNDGVSRAQTGNGMADFLLGMASSGIYGNPQGEDVVVPYYGFFIQDDWKITPRLTMNAGLRWELFQTGYFPNPDKQSAGRYLIEINGVKRENEKFVFPKDGKDCGCDDDFNNFAPRLGLAFRLNESTVLRAGAGLYYGEADQAASQAVRFATGPPRHVEITLPVSRERPALVVSTGFPRLVTGIVPPNVSVRVAKDFEPTLYAGQWFVDIQRKLRWETVLTVGYNGTATSHLATARNINTPLTPHATTPWPLRRIRPEFAAVTLGENSLNASYQSLQFKAEKRFSKGFTFLSSFTWSHNIDYGREVLGRVGVLDRTSHYDISRERGNSDLDRRLAYNLSFLYELPFGRGRHWLRTGAANWIAGGWQVGGIVSLLSGLPNDHTINVDRQNTGGRARGDWARDPNLPTSERTIDRWFDTTFAVPSEPGLIGNAGRNLIYGPGTKNVDLIVSKNFAMPWEGHHLQFRFESFNLSNTPNFGNPNTAVGTPGVGQINSAGEPRRIQFGLKYLF